MFKKAVLAGVLTVAALAIPALTPQKADAQFFFGGRRFSIGVGTPYYGYGGYGYGGYGYGYPRYYGGYGYRPYYYGYPSYGYGYRSLSPLRRPIFWR